MQEDDFPRFRGPGTSYLFGVCQVAGWKRLWLAVWGVAKHVKDNIFGVLKETIRNHHFVVCLWSHTWALFERIGHWRISLQCLMILRGVIRPVQEARKRALSSQTNSSITRETQWFADDCLLLYVGNSH